MSSFPGRMKYRSAVGSALAALAALALAACGDDSSSTDTSSSTQGSAGETEQIGGEVTISGYGGEYQRFQAECFWDNNEAGVKVLEDEGTSAAKAKAMVEAGRVTWDIMVTENAVGTERDADFLEPIDYAAAGLEPSDFIEGYAGKYRVGADAETLQLSYRSGEFDEAPTGMADLFDTERFPGKRAFPSYASSGILEAALIADGVPMDELYPLDVDRALAKLDTIKNDIVYWDDGGPAEQLLRSGETPIGLFWGGPVARAADAEPDVETAWDQWIPITAYWVILKGAPNADTAQKFLGVLTDPERQACFADKLPYGPTRKDAVELAKETRYGDELPTSHLDGRVPYDDAWWAENNDAVSEQFEQWKQGG